MSTSEQEKRVIEADTAAAADRRRVARRERRRDPRGRGSGDRRDACARSPTRRPRTPRPRSTPPCDAQAEWAATAPERPRARSSIAPSSCSTSAPTTWPLLMTLEMGKSVAESKGEIAYAAEFFRWFSGEALRIDGYYKSSPATAPRACWSCASRSAPATSSPPGTSRPRWAPARSARRSPPAARWSSKPAQQTPLSMLALAQLLEECGLPAGVLNVVTGSSSSDDLEADHRRPAAAQALLHRLDRGRPQADRAGRRQRPQGLDGARRQRPVPDLRGRRPRRRGRGRDDRQDAQRRRGLHGGQPLPRRTSRSPRSSPRSSPRGWAR